MLNLYIAIALIASSNRLRGRCGIPADDIQHHDEVVVFEVGHVCSQDVGLHFQLDVLRSVIRREGSFVFEL